MNDKIASFDTWGTIRKNPIAALKEVERLVNKDGVDKLLIVGWDATGRFFSQGSDMTIAEANYLLDRAKLITLEVPTDNG